MTLEATRIRELTDLWVHVSEPTPADVDYSLLAGANGIYVARAKTGTPALVIQLPEVPSGALGRRAGGCELLPYASLQFVSAKRAWTAAAAAFLCTDQDLLDVFVVLAADLERRLGSCPREWRSIVSLVEEWQSLMAPRGRTSMEAEVGLWGEIWLLTASAAPDRLLSAWRGPDREPVDFFLDGKAVEVKTSRLRRQHWVSFAQVMNPVGDAEAWLLSLWIGLDPIRGETVPAMATRLLARVGDPAQALRRLAAAGYVAGDRAMYDMRIALLSEPEWYPMGSVPRVRSADPGVSRLRYTVSLDETHREHAAAAASLWRHFLACDYGSTDP
jgi:hypothetical protein